MAGLSLWRPSGGIEVSKAPPMNTPQKKKETITPAKAYSESVPQQANDYSDIMSRYRSALDQPSGMGSLMQNYQNLLTRSRQPSSLSQNYENILNQDPLVSEDQNYERGPEQGAAFGNLSELAKTGGYSDANIADLRARGTSPIRSVYANAMRELERNKALQGGYSPGAGAASAKMAREQAGLLSGATTNINAGIAENRAANRLSAAPSYMSAASHETDLMNEIARRNLDARTGAESFNLQRELAALSGMSGEKNRLSGEELAALSGMGGIESFDAGREGQLLSGMTSLYGTSPALASTFGDQTQRAAELDSANKARGLTIPRKSGGLALGGSNTYRDWR